VSRSSTEWGVYVRIASALRERISVGKLPPGPFPSEAKLCDEFKVTRNTLRRALHILHEEGLIEALPGRGRVIRPEEERGMSSNPDPSQYKQIADDIQAAIKDGRFPSGARLPAESDLTERYGVSRATVRQALANLSSSGLVQPVQGKGWFVR
jgi:DNA-binding GntR family transcriptional regulator